ncbi:armadillo-like helical domain-containing protein [Cavenderia fasciculata]|uniref:Exportin-T n=1 Tax=Cavenderia fasciculata TaxID=261658 RepID=F4QAN6_CACFS|nr:armadillo-like helical domain-containing protein [Cavenderia fasciculata]EGG15755.1 armadillo-like helical domain-containing protein [Cavenderia fasciculata]|eukprot:XP_004354502.1 armadillo-like helical domain-containing protein [Cavenderia fasciculata]
MDEFETAVTYSFDPLIEEDLKQKALQYTNNVKESPEGWKFCLERLFKTNSVHVKFFCFHVFQDLILHKHASLSEFERTKLKSTLIDWVKIHLTKNTEELAIKNKYAQIVVLLFKQEYPEQWPNFFNEYLSLLQVGGVPAIDIFLRILKAIDEEVVSFNVHRSTTELAQNTQIKDSMREGAIKDIVKSWYDILMVYHKTMPQLAKLALQNIKYYVGWIDINLIVNDKFIPLFCQLLNSNALREEICECFKEIINKGMDSKAKMLLIQQLQIKNIVKFVVLDDVDFIVKIGNLVNLTGMEVLRSLESQSTTTTSATAASAQQTNGNHSKSNGTPDTATTKKVSSPIVDPQGEQLLDEMLGLLFEFLNNENNEVSSTVLGFSALYITRLKNIKPLNEKQVEHITMLVQIIRNKMRYPADYNFQNSEGESEQQFLELRSSLASQFRNIFRLCPEMVGSFVDTLLNNVIPNLERFSFSDIEVSIHLLYQMGEGISHTSEETMKAFEKFFGQMVVFLASSKIARTEIHQIVSLTYFDTVVRYAKNIPSTTENLTMILASFLDGRGVHSRNPIVRSRAGNLLNKLVKQLKIQLFPFINNIIESLKNHLIISYDIQKEVPQCKPPTTRRTKLCRKDLVASLQKNGRDHLEGTLQTDTKELPYHSTQLYQLISVIGTFSKGFSPFNFSTNQPKPEPCPYKIYFTKSLQLIIQLPNLLPLNEDIKSRTYFYLHRMVDCLGNDLKPMLTTILPTLLNHSSQKIENISEFILFINQLMNRFKDSISSIMNELLSPIIMRVYKPIEQSAVSPPEPNSDEERAIAELQKTYYTFLVTVLSSSLSAVFTTSSNLPMLPAILTSVINGCTNANDALQKTSFTIVRKMTEEFGQSGNKPIEGFGTFVYESVLPVCFQVPLQPNYNMLELQEIIKTLKLIGAKYGHEIVITYLSQKYLPLYSTIINKSASEQILSQFSRLLPPTTPNKDFQEFFKNFIKQLKSSPK